MGVQELKVGGARTASALVLPAGGVTLSRTGVQDQLVVFGVPRHEWLAGLQHGALGTYEGACQLARYVKCYSWGLGNLGGFFNHMSGQNAELGYHVWWWSLCAWKCSWHCPVPSDQISFGQVFGSRWPPEVLSNQNYFVTQWWTKQICWIAYLFSGCFLS